MAVAIEPSLQPLATASTAAAEIQGLSYWYPETKRPALRDVDLSIEPGLTLVAGPSGGGKSTLLRVLNGLVPQFHGGRIAGRVTVGGLDAFRTPIARLAAVTGLVFQDPETQSVYGTADREIAFALENAAMPRLEMHRRVDEVMDRLGIEALRGRRLATLSGGERQRVQLAAVLALRPRLVALDEPTSQLDADGAAALLAACLELAADASVVVAEHRWRQLVAQARSLVVVSDGESRLADRHDLAFRTPPVPVPRPERSSAELAWEVRRASIAPAQRHDPVLTDLDIAGSRGEVVAITGPNGSGKTTLLRAIAGLLAPMSGTVSRAPGRVAYLPQSPASLLHLPTVRAEIELTLRRSVAGSRTGRAAADGWTAGPAEGDRLLDAFGLLHLADRYPRDLSGGERQRAALAAVLAGRPSLALLDEPTRGMDLVARNRLIAAVRSLADEGAAIVIATHDNDLIAALADRVFVVRDGGVRAVGLEPGAASGPRTASRTEPGSGPEPLPEPGPGPEPRTAAEPSR